MNRLTNRVGDLALSLEIGSGLKDLVSNLSTKGQSLKDGLDSQIKDGVDYFPDMSGKVSLPKQIY